MRLRKIAFQSIPNNIMAILACLLVLIPEYLVIANSLKSSVQARTMSAALPTALHLEIFVTVIERGKLIQSFVNSMLSATTATIICTLLSALAAYVLARNRTSLNRLIYFFMVMGIAMPLNFFTLTK